MQPSQEVVPRRRAVFLDRDGTLNVEKHYLFRYEDWEWIPGAVEAVRRIRSMGFAAIVVTNQSGIGRGYYREEDLVRLHALVDAELAVAGTRVDRWYWCPHSPDHEPRCDCRKPRPGMLTQAAQELGIDLERSFLVGDKRSDVQAARAAGVVPILVGTGYGREHRIGVGDDVIFEPSILQAVDAIGGHCD